VTFDLWPWKSIGFQTLLRTKYVPSLVKIHWRMLILEWSQGCYGRKDSGITISLRNFVGEGIISPSVGNLCHYNLIDWFFVLNATFSYITATSFSGRRSRSPQREPLTMGKQLVNFIICGCELSAPFFVIYKAGRKTNAVLVIGLYELLGNPTT
jgi:hypothetical protein